MEAGGTRTEGSGPTERELQVLLAFAQTGTTIAAGKLVGLSRQTVRNYLHSIHQRLGVETSVEAVWLLRRELEGVVQTWKPV